MNKYVTELIGTFFLVLTVGLSLTDGTEWAPLAIGSVLMAMVYMGGHISGAHYNPAVSLAVLLRGKLASADAVKYMIFQLIGAVLAALATWWLADETFVLSKGIGISTLQAFVAEVLFTFALALVVLQTEYNDATSGNSYYGLAIGFTVMIGTITVGGISGGAFNPAVGIGPIIVGAIAGTSGFGDALLYLIGPFAGGALAAVVFKRQSG
jgi:aquaporin Z